MPAGSLARITDLSPVAQILLAVSLFVGGALALFFLFAKGMGEAVLIGIVPAAAGAGIVVYQRLAGGTRDRGGS